MVVYAESHFFFNEVFQVLLTNRLQVTTSETVVHVSSLAANKELLHVIEL